MDAAFLRAVWASGLARILVFLFFYSFAVATLFPLVPTLLTNFFASVRAHGEDIDCESFGRGQAPAACQNAHSDVVVWSSWTSFVSNTLVSATCGEYLRLGRWMLCRAFSSIFAASHALLIALNIVFSCQFTLPVI